MKQILQNLKTGITELADVPVPAVKPGHLLIRSKMSVISAGTEKMLVDFGKANLLDKARQQPDKVRQVLDKVKTDGIIPTIESVRAKLDQPLPLGYSNVGVVEALGQGVTGFSVGDRVISNGHHAEYVCVSQNLCQKVPDDVEDEEAAFTVIGAIALQGIRLAQPTMGEQFVVTGLGLIGLMAVQLLVAHGCRVLGIDLDKQRCMRAKEFGAEVVDLSTGIDPVSAAEKFSKGRGVDGVIITASTKSSEPVRQAAHMSRKRGRIVLVGVTGLELSRADFYEKELSFQVSCSYGPGRYDPNYEDKGNDYPYAFVRWTEQRNFEAILELLSTHKINMASLITDRFPLDQAVEAYNLLNGGKETLGILLKYPERDENTEKDDQIVMMPSKSKVENKSTPQVAIGMIGSGNYTNQILVPAVKKTGARLVSIASSGGVSGVHVGRRFGFEETTTNTDSIIDNNKINCVFITTRHNSHAHFTISALEAGKHTFVEKPLCIRRSELERVAEIVKNSVSMLMVGFNRRFAPHIIKMKELLQRSMAAKTMIITVNAGAIPPEHWIQDKEVGGGRIIGEVCHFIDLLRFLAGVQITGIQATSVGQNAREKISDDKVSITVSFEDGSIGTVHYFANGHRSYPKEKVEVFTDGKILSLDNYKTLKGYGWSDFKKMKLWSQDKGHVQCVRSFVDAIARGLPSPISPDELLEVTARTIEAAEMVTYTNGE